MLNTVLLLILWRRVVSASDPLGVGDKTGPETVVTAECTRLRCLQDLEFARQQGLWSELRTRGIAVRGFYHTATMYKHWPSVMKEQLLLMNGQHKDFDCDVYNCSGYYGKHGRQHFREGYGLFSVMDQLYMHVSDLSTRAHPNITADQVLDSLKLKHRHKVDVHHEKGIGRRDYLTYYLRNDTKQMARIISEGATSGEYPTLTALHNYCIRQVAIGQNSIVFYVHLKSAGDMISDDANMSPGASWRELMNTFILEYPSTCIRALLNGSSTCGTLHRSTPSPHYSGNFWWASCNHIAHLPPLYSASFGFMDAEMWLLRIGHTPSVAAPFVRHCAYDAVGDAMFRDRFKRQSDSIEDYLPLAIQYAASNVLPVCGLAMQTYHGMPDVNKSRHYRSSSCGDSHTKDSLWQGRPCLSPLTPPGSQGANPYNISDRVEVAWNRVRGPINLDMKMCLHSRECISNFTRTFRATIDFLNKSISKLH
jgi:hypothetical protein